MFRKLLSLSMFVLAAAAPAAAQNGLENIIVEKYYVSNAADAANANTALTDAGYSTGTLPAGSVTWRIYADLLPGWGVQSVYGVPSHPLLLSTTTSFFNHPNGNSTGGNFASNSSSIIGDGTTLLDSYLSCGAVAPGRFGVIKTEDNSAAVPTGGGTNLVINPNTVLANNDPTAAPALTSADGLYNTANNPALLALTLLGDAASGPINILTDGSIIGNSFNSTNCSWGVLGEQVGAFPTGTNRVLIGQFTSDGVFTYALNIQLRNNTTFAVQNFVNSNPTGNEILLTALAGTLNQANAAPTVSITAPTAGTSYLVGDVVNIAATAADADGSVASVEFFVNGVSVGVDNTAPYTATYTAAGIGSKAITARATDNLGAQTTSAAVNVTVGSNNAPTVSVTAPSNGALVIGGAAVNITATAADSDGSITQVEFFVSGISVGVDNSSPFAVSWTSASPFGNRVITAVATDNAGATTTSAGVTINVQNPNALAYTVGNISAGCSNSTFCLPISAIDTVANVIGYDIVLDYDAAKVTPTGAIVRKNDLLQPSFNSNMVSTAFSNDATNGKAYISVYFNGSAPSSARFSGTGDIICVEFAKTGLGTNDTAVFVADTLLESRITGVQLVGTDAGSFINYSDSLFSGSLKFWLDFSPIKYNQAAPGDYLVTNIYSNNSSCNARSATASQPDVNGIFNFNVNSGSRIEIVKDVASATDVQPVINGFDAFLMRRVLVNDASFVPSVYQIIAMDVNTDGVVSAGDLSQINQRAVLLLPEFQQDWNYNAQGVSNGQPSRDWLFVDVTTFSSNPNYAVSSTYPSNDGVGYSKNRVPQVEFCSPIPVSLVGDCPLIGTENYIGLMLGDVNGNYASNNGAPSPFRSTSDAVVFDAARSYEVDGFVNVPVRFTGASVHSIDFSFNYDRSQLEFVSATDLSGQLMMLTHESSNDQLVRFTSSSLQEVSGNAAVAALRFRKLNDNAVAGIQPVNAFLDGESVSTEVTSRSQNAAVPVMNVYPNPAQDLLFVLSSVDVQLELTDISGRTLMTINNVLAGERTDLSVAGVANGVYVLKAISGDQVSTTRIVVKR
jgi:hypothetical protein